MTAEKLRIAEESFNAGTTVVEFARQRALHPNLVHASRVERARVLLAYKGNPSFYAVSQGLGMSYQTVRRIATCPGYCGAMP